MSRRLDIFNNRNVVACRRSFGLNGGNRCYGLRQFRCGNPCSRSRAMPMRSRREKHCPRDTRSRPSQRSAQPTRLAIFRLLVKHEPVGITAGVIAETVGAPHNTLSSHLAILVRAGLLRSSRDGRTIIYRSDVEGIRSVIAFLVNDCCDGHPELCNLVAADAAACCAAAPPKTRSAKKAVKRKS